MDTGGAIKGRRVDVYMRSHRTARHFGVNRRRVWVVRRGDPRYRECIARGNR
jgi:membrane-bound lytic murein transglycosylase